MNAALLLLLGGLTLLVLFDANQQPAKAPQLTSLNILDINSIQIKQKNGAAISFQLNNKNWQLTSPISVNALNEKIERLLKISQIKVQANYPLDSDQLSIFGLNPPLVELHFNDTKLFIGKIDSVNQRRYVSHGTKLFLVDDTFLHLLTNKPHSYIDTRLLPDNVEVTGLATPEFELIQQNDGSWIDALDTSSTEQKALSSDNVQLLLDEWRFARAISVNTTPSNDNIHTTNSDIFLNLANGENLHFIVKTTNNDAILSSPRRQLDYHFSLSKLKQLLNLPDA
jgi:hypothetical protein